MATFIRIVASSSLRSAATANTY